MSKLYFHKAREKKLWRCWFRYRKFETRLEISTAHTGPSFRFHLGNRSSETPIDWHICLFWVNFYGSFDWPGLGKFCGWIGHGHKRDLHLSIHSGQLWWKIWYDDDMGYDNYHKCDKRRKTWWWPFSWYRLKYRSWMCLREGCIDLNPISALWDIRYYSYETVKNFTIDLNVNEFEEDIYRVDMELQEVYRNRNQGPSLARWISFEGYSVAWRCDDGIPVRNHDWKGGTILASSVNLPEGDIDDWVEVASQLLIERIKKDRRRYSYRPSISKE